MNLITLTALSHYQYWPWAFAVSIRIGNRAKFNEFVADLKSSIPSRYRRWEGERRRWLVKESEFVTVAALIRKHNLPHELVDERPKDKALAENFQSAGAADVPF